MDIVQDKFNTKDTRDYKKKKKKKHVVLHEKTKLIPLNYYFF